MGLRERIASLEQASTSKAEKLVFVIMWAGNEDAEVKALEVAGVEVSRLPGESFDALKARAGAMCPDEGVSIIHARC
jgi:hypothetical protein